MRAGDFSTGLSPPSRPRFLPHIVSAGFDSDIHHDIDLVRKIRNRFAHSLHGLDLESPPVRQLIDEFKVADRHYYDWTELRAVATVDGKGFVLYTGEPPEEAGEPLKIQAFRYKWIVSVLVAAVAASLGLAVRDQDPQTETNPDLGSEPDRPARMGNIQNARFDWSDLVYTSDDDEIAKYLLHEGDVLFNRTNSPELVGKTAIYQSELPAIFAGYLIRVNQISAVVESQYLNLFLNSDVARQYGDSVKTDGVNQSNINGAKLVNYPFPYCSVQEQREIVRILDKTMSIVDDAEAKIDAELERTVALRQAILKKAFAGHLVAQDPGDEPASVLLEKITTERAKAGPTARRDRKAKTAA